MPLLQLSIDFDNITHAKENNRHSEKILFDHYERLSKNCKILYDAFMRGEKLTGLDIIHIYKMTEYRKRISDLKEAGIQFQERVIKNGAKVWWVEKG